MTHTKDIIPVLVETVDVSKITNMNMIYEYIARVFYNVDFQYFFRFLSSNAAKKRV